MDWLEVSIHTTQAGIEAVCGRLMGIGIDNVEIIDDEAEVKAHLDRIRAYWDYVDHEALMKGRTGPKVRAYLTNNPVGEKALATLLDSIEALRQIDVGLDLGSLTVDVRSVNDDDWENNWKQYFKPLPIGEKLLILPEWEQADANGRTVLKIDPKFLFGTGQHSSTRLCLEGLEAWLRPEDKMLDIGTGSGILALAALLLGAQSATAVDVEPNVVQVVDENRSLNQIAENRLKVLCGDAVTSSAVQTSMGSGYDLICINIVADVIIRLLPLAYEKAAPGGMVICSGIIDEREADVCQAMEAQGWQLQKVLRHEGWSGLIAKKAGE